MIHGDLVLTCRSVVMDAGTVLGHGGRPVAVLDGCDREIRHAHLRDDDGGLAVSLVQTQSPDRQSSVSSDDGEGGGSPALIVPGFAAASAWIPAKLQEITGGRVIRLCIRSVAMEIIGCSPISSRRS